MSERDNEDGAIARAIIEAFDLGMACALRNCHVNAANGDLTNAMIRTANAMTDLILFLHMAGHDDMSLDARSGFASVFAVVSGGSEGE